jgi:hypothetical protein
MAGPGAKTEKLLFASTSFVTPPKENGGAMG